MSQWFQVRGSARAFSDAPGGGGQGEVCRGGGGQAAAGVDEVLSPRSLPQPE